VFGIFNSLGGGEVLVILVLALIVLGPEKLPEAMRRFGNIYGELRRMSEGFQSELRDAFDEPMQELRGTAQMMQDAVNQPVQAVSDQLREPGSPDGVEEVQAPVEEVQAPVEEATEPVPADIAAPVLPDVVDEVADDGMPLTGQPDQVSAESRTDEPPADERMA
jgi:sec-independent protein translocase protein TatB